MIPVATETWENGDHCLQAAPCRLQRRPKLGPPLQVLIPMVCGRCPQKGRLQLIFCGLQACIDWKDWGHSTLVKWSSHTQSFQLQLIWTLQPHLLLQTSSMCYLQAVVNGHQKSTDLSLAVNNFESWSLDLLKKPWFAWGGLILSYLQPPSADIHYIWHTPIPHKSRWRIRK